MRKKTLLMLVVTGLILVIMALPLVTACAKPAPAPAPTPAPAPKATTAPAPKPTTAPAPKATPAPAPKTTGAPGAAIRPAGELPKTITIATASTGSSYIFTEGLVTILNRFGPGFKASSSVVTGTTQRFTGMRDKKFDLTPISAMGPVMMRRGDLGPEMQQIRLRVLCAGGGGSQTHLAVTTLPNAGIKSVKDLRGKRFYGDLAATPQFAIVSESLLKANGMTKNDVKWLVASTPTDGYKDLKEGRVDAFNSAMGPGTIEMSQTTGLFIVPLTPQEQAAAHNDFPAVNPGTVPKGLFGAPVDTPVVVSPVVWWATENLSEITAYTILKTMYEHTQELGAIHPSLKGFNLENALLSWAIPYHSGAILYFKEKGIWGAEQDKKQQELLKLEK